mgnify:CR=1 FL=1
MQLQTTTPGSYPIPFTWSNACTGAGGSGLFVSDWQSQFFGPTDADRTRPHGAPVRIVRRDLDCAPCGRPTCPLRHHACMTELSVDEVVEAIEGQLALVGHGQEPQREVAPPGRVDLQGGQVVGQGRRPPLRLAIAAGYQGGLAADAGHDVPSQCLRQHPPVLVPPGAAGLTG